VNDPIHAPATFNSGENTFSTHWLQLRNEPVL